MVLNTCTLGVSSTVLPSRNNYCFFETLSSFCIFKKALFLSLGTQSSRLNTWDLILEHFEHRGSRFEFQLTFERYCIKLKQTKQSQITEEYFSTLQFIVTTETVCEYFMTNLFTSKILKKLYPFRLPLGLRYEKRSNKI